MKKLLTVNVGRPRPNPWKGISSTGIARTALLLSILMMTGCRWAAMQKTAVIRAASDTMLASIVKLQSATPLTQSKTRVAPAPAV